MNREEVKTMLINDIKEKRPEMAERAEEIASFTLAQPSLQSDIGLNSFLVTYLREKEAKHETN